MNIIGDRFQEGEYFVGDLIFAGELLTDAINKLKPIIGSAFLSPNKIKRKRGRKISNLTKDKKIRLPAKFEVFSTVIFMLLIIAIGYGVLGYNLEIMLLVNAFYYVIIMSSSNLTWKYLEEGVMKKFSSISSCMLILLGIGFFISTWIFSGTVPVIVSWLVQLVNVKYVLVLSFLLCSIVSLITGTSFGTIGVLMYSVSTVQVVSPGI